MIVLLWFQFTIQIVVNVCRPVIWIFIFWYSYIFCLQEDLTPKDMKEILDDIKAGKKPKAGPR